MDLDLVTRRVREEFREMPGLRLTPAQATRLWGLEQDLCRQVIDALIHTHGARQHILLVGHEPYLSRLISTLVTGSSALPLVMKKGGLCKLSIDTLRFGRCATLEWLLTPRQLRLMA